MVNKKLIPSVLSLFIFVLFACEEKKEANNSVNLEAKQVFTPVIIAQEETAPNETFEYYKLEINGKAVFSSVNGQLEKGEVPFEVGTRFKKNDLLFQINNREAFKVLMMEKKRISNLLNDLSAEININQREDFEAIQNYNQNFFKNIIISDLPKLTQKNEALLKKNGVYKKINNVKKMEANMEKYFILAPYNGQILNIYSPLNSTIEKNKVILKIGQKSTYKINIKEDHLADKLEVYNYDGEKIGIAKKSNSTMYNFIANNRFNGQEQIVKIKSPNKRNRLDFYVPKSALKNNEISILKDNIVIHHKIEIVEKTNDGYWITGIKNQDLILVNFE